MSDHRRGRPQSVTASGGACGSTAWTARSGRQAEYRVGDNFVNALPYGSIISDRVENRQAWFVDVNGVKLSRRNTIFRYWESYFQCNTAISQNGNP
ncbi:hypothetical protein ACIQMJ_26840 [Actinosynnema sp. NPDC091369]